MQVPKQGQIVRPPAGDEGARVLLWEKTMGGIRLAVGLRVSPLIPEAEPAREGEIVVSPEPTESPARGFPPQDPTMEGSR